MAIILFGSMVAGARGKVGGLVFSANQGGPYVKAWSRSSNPRTPEQTTVRDRFAAKSSQWKDLTQAQRDDWDDYADDPAQELTNSLGIDYFISGHDWYTKINYQLEEGGAADRVDAPTLTRPTAPVIDAERFIPTGGSPNSFVQFDNAQPTITELHLVRGMLFFSVGRGSATGPFRFLNIAVPNVNDRVVIQSDMETVWGTIATNQKVFIEALVQDAHGQRSPVDTTNEAVE